MQRFSKIITCAEKQIAQQELQSQNYALQAETAREEKCSSLTDSSLLRCMIFQPATFAGT